MADKRRRLIEIIAAKSLNRGGSYKLASGGASVFYFDMKPTLLDPEGASLAGDLVLDSLADEPVDLVGGLALGAIPAVAAVVQRSHARGRPIPGFFVRKEEKERGTERLIEGNIAAGRTAVIVEDVTTKGMSSLKAVEAARAAGCKVTTVVTIVDRLEGAEEGLRRHGLRLVALTTRDDFTL